MKLGNLEFTIVKKKKKKKQFTIALPISVTGINMFALQNFAPIFPHLVMSCAVGR